MHLHKIRTNLFSGVALYFFSNRATPSPLCRTGRRLNSAPLRESLRALRRDDTARGSIRTSFRICRVLLLRIPLYHRNSFFQVFRRYGWVTKYIFRILYIRHCKTNSEYKEGRARRRVLRRGNPRSRICFAAAHSCFLSVQVFSWWMLASPFIYRFTRWTDKILQSFLTSKIKFLPKDENVHNNSEYPWLATKNMNYYPEIRDI